MTRVVAIVQARMGSTRLPGKVLAPLGDRTLLEQVVRRGQAAATVTEVWVATTTEALDDPVEAVARARGVRVFRGSTDDVLDRFARAAEAAAADVIVRLTADDPFKDPAVIDAVVRRLLDEPALDYVSNTVEPTYPEGLDVEAFRREALHRAWREAALTSEREHVTPYIWKHPDRFRLAQVRHRDDLSARRWTVDHPDDLRFARAVYARCGDAAVFGLDAVLAALDADPALRGLEPRHRRNAAYDDAVARERGDQETLDR